MIYFKALTLKNGQPEKFGGFLLESGKPALAPSKNDTDDFSRIMELQEPARQEAKGKGNHRIVQAFNYFLERIDVNDVDVMTLKRNIQLVCIEVDEGEDEQQIFDTINSRGVRLTTAELLKNYFFSRETVEDYQKCWESVFEVEDDLDYWSQEIVTGRIRRSLIDLFFDSFLQIKAQQKNYGVSTEDKKSFGRVDWLFTSYKEFIEKYYGGEDRKLDLVRELKPCADVFKRTFDPGCVQRAVPRDSSIGRLNVVIFGLKNSTLIPYVLYIAKNVKDPAVRDEMYGAMESYVMRRVVCRSTTKNYNRFFSSLILGNVLDPDVLCDEFASQEDSTTQMPTDEEVKSAFTGETRYINLQTRGILYLIESKERPANSSTVLLGFDGYSLEHLMPKKWRNNWGRLATEGGGRNCDATLLTLGNLAIITQALNASIRDAGWVTKKAGKNGAPGFEGCAAGLTTMDGVLSAAAWDEEKIHERAKRLADMAVRVWPK